MLRTFTLRAGVTPNAAFTKGGFLETQISTCLFAVDGTGDITVGAAHGLSAGQQVRFTTTTQLPVELNAATAYYVLSSGLTTTKLRISATLGGSVITFSFAGSSLSCFVRTDTFDHTKVPSTQTDIPIPVSVTHADLKSVANGGHVQNASGFDIRAYADSALTIPLSIDLEYYNPATGQVVMWVKIPSLSSSVDTVIYLTYGVASMTIDATSPLTWSNGFLGVYHLGNGTTLSVASSTGANNGTNTNGVTAAAGQIDGCGSFVNASTQYIAVGSGINPAAITLSAWVKATSFPAAYNSVLGRIQSTSYAEILIKSTGKLGFFVVAGGPTGSAVVSFDGTGINTLVAGTWYYLAQTYDSVSGLKGYVGTVGGSMGVDGSVAANGTLNTQVTPARIGSDALTAGREFNGLLDEARFASVARSNDWLTVELNSQGSPATFQTLGTEGTGTIPPNGSGIIWKSTLNYVFQFDPGRAPFSGVMIDERGTALIAPRRSHAPELVIRQDTSNALSASVGTVTFFGKVITSSAVHGLSVGNEVRFTGSVSQLPVPLAQNARYYVVAVLSTTRFMVSDSLGGFPIDFGSQTDVLLRTGAPVAKDIWLQAFPTVTLWKAGASSSPYLIYDDGNFGWIWGFMQAFGWVQRIACTATETLAIASVPRIPGVVGATESLTITATVVVPVERFVVESLEFGPFSSTTDCLAVVSRGRVATEALSTADSPISLTTYNRGAAESLTISVVNTALAFVLFRRPVENLLVSDAPSLFFPRVRFATQLLTMTDEARRFLGPTAFASEALIFTDTATRQTTLFRRIVSDFLTIADIARQITPLVRTCDAGTLQWFFKKKPDVSRTIVHHRFVSFADLLLNIGVVATAPARIGYNATESLVISELVTRIYNQNPTASDSLVIADIATWLASRVYSATDTLVIADAPAYRAVTPSFATENLSIAVAVGLGGGVWHRTGDESLVISDLASARFAILRGVIELLKIEHQPAYVRGWLRYVFEALAIAQFVDFSGGLPDPWEYYLDLRTGNLPVESTLDTPDAESMVDVPDAESEVEVPEAESELAGSVAESGGFRYIDP